MPLWVHPVENLENDRKLVASWRPYQRSQDGLNNKTDNPKKDYQDAFDDNPTPLPDTVNVNTADSATLVRFKGIGPVTAGKIVARRKDKGPFTSIEQLTEVGRFPDATFELLKKHLSTR